MHDPCTAHPSKCNCHGAIQTNAAILLIPGAPAAQPDTSKFNKIFKIPAFTPLEKLPGAKLINPKKSPVKRGMVVMEGATVAVSVCFQTWGSKPGVQDVHILWSGSRV